MIKKYLCGDVVIDKRAGLDGKTRVIFVTSGPVAERCLTINSSMMGMEVGGLMITTKKELEGLAELIANAWSEHLKLAPRITSKGVIE